MTAATPRGGWHPMGMRWSRLAFLHWAVDPEPIRDLLPPGLALDLFAGQAWLGVVPFAMSRVRLRGIPAVPGTSTFLELNVRTYVTSATGEPGVYFFSLDANHRLAVRSARLLYGLPYLDAHMACEPGQDGWTNYSSRRVHHGASPGVFAGRYRAIPGRAAGGLDDAERAAFLTQRYALFTGGLKARGPIRRGGVRHAPWELDAGEVEIHRMDLTSGLGVSLDRPPDAVHIARPVEVHATLPGRV